MSADLKLLSLLEKVNNPIEQINIKIKASVYGFPDEWRVTDELNPNIFANVLKYQNNTAFGEIKARELTEKEKYEEAQKSKKNKKETKNAEEEETIKRAIQQEEEEEQRKQKLYQTVSEQEKFFLISEDKNKTAHIRYNDYLSVTINTVREWEENIIQKKNFIYFYRQPALSEEELVKLKKAKTKGINNQELTQIGFKVAFDLSAFLEPGVQETLVRGYVVQEDSADAPKYNVSNFYLKLQVEIDPALTPLVKEVEPIQIEQVSIQKLPTKLQAVKAFQYDITLAMQALSEEYMMRHPSDQKQKNLNVTITTQKKLELQQKKEKFLADMNTSGNYKLLKDRLRTSIVRVCIDKFQREGLFVGVNKDEQDRLFAEIYVFMMEEMQKTLSQFVTTNKEEIHEDLFLTYVQNIQERDRVYNLLFKETPLEKFRRLAEEYELINQTDQALKYYTNMVIVDKKASYEFALYCIKIQRFNAAEQLLSQVRLEYQEKDMELLAASLLIRRERYHDALKIIQQLLTADPIDELLNLFYAFIYRYIDQNMSDKYLRCTQRIYMRKIGLLTKGFNKQNVDPHILPNFKQQMIEQQEKAKKAPVLTQQQIDSIHQKLVDYFVSQNLFDLAEKALTNVKDKTTQKINVIKAQIHIFNQNYPQAQEIIAKILATNPKFEVYLIKGILCYQTEQFYEAEETFLKALSLSYKKPFQILLRLGFLYLKRKSWEDAKIIFEKALDQTPNSSLSWLGLGIAYLRLNVQMMAEECFQQANIYEPFNGEVWGYMALNCLLQKRGQQAKQCLIQMEKTEVNDLELLLELGDEMYKCQDFESSKNLYLRIYNSKVQIVNHGQLLRKLGEVYRSLMDYDQARSFFEDSLKYLIGDNEKREVQLLLKDI